MLWKALKNITFNLEWTNPRYIAVIIRMINLLRCLVKVIRILIYLVFVLAILILILCIF